MPENNKNREKLCSCRIENDLCFPDDYEQIIEHNNYDNIQINNFILSSETIENIQILTENSLKLFLNGNRPLSLTKLAEKLNIHRKTFSKYAKNYLKDTYGDEKGNNLYKAMWSKGISNEDYNRVKELTNIALFMNCKGEKPPSLRELSKNFLFTSPTLAKYIKKYLKEKFGTEKAKNLYNELWSKQKREKISLKQIKKIQENIESALYCEIIGESYPTMQDIGKDLVLSDCTIRKYTKEYLIQKFGIRKGNNTYDKVWGKYLDSEIINKIKNSTYFALYHFEKGVKPPSIFSLSSICETNQYTFSYYAKEYLIEKFQSNKKGLEIYKKIWLSKYEHEDLQRLACTRGVQETGIAGELITSESEFNELTNDQYPSDLNLWWWCGKNNHYYWKATPTNIQQGSWCPYCSEGKSEAIIRWYFEKIFNSKFKKTMIYDIIQNYDGKMHFDGYSTIKLGGRLIKLAFEYNGYQHYEFPNYFHQTLEEFEKQQNRDRLKEKLCLENNIILIVFPYNIDISLKNPKKIQDFIVEQFKERAKIRLLNISYYDHRKIPFNYIEISTH
ncbi:MAG: hypothetical protein ACFFCM_08545 [Promethearchaeota archaeon]